MVTAQSVAASGQHLAEEEIRTTLRSGLSGLFRGQQVLVLIPDHTRSVPLPMLFRMMVDVLGEARRLDFMVALGTHPPLSAANLNQLVGISAEERATTYARIGLFNHTWDDPHSLISLGLMTYEEVKALAGEYAHPSLAGDVDILINKSVLEYDHLIILGPTFPHEVVGFSGGAKYLFPGISGAAMIHKTHWLGALAGVVGTIGLRDTPVRAMIHAAAARLPIPVTLIALVVEEHDLSGIFIGDHLKAWYSAVELSAQRHIRWCDQPFQRVLSCAPPMYDELWTAAKAMYKLEPAVAIGGEVVIYAPHLEIISNVHGKHIQEIGYHILPYFLEKWERFRHIPLGVLAHSTHVRGSGIMDGRIEKPNVKVTLASKIPAEVCERLNLGYLDPATIHPADWQNREHEGILYVPRAGEILYRIRPSS